ncbi:MAG: HD domain-containing protein [Planctomycetia bacterium]|nr:HD domain-containing protein [Planctomycetia bacterium]
MSDKLPKNYRKALEVVRILKSVGAKDVLFVGGYVRDYLLGIPSKDYDLEVYGLDYDAIYSALAPYFFVNQVGRSFQVLKVDHQIDIALPRREVKSGRGHKEFQIISDPDMTFAEAAGRRDFTINAIGMRADGTLCDPYDGVGDLKRKILRAPTEAFCEDPLRVLRGMQFAARFGMEMEPRTVTFCRRVLPEFSSLSEERIFDEWYKWAVKGNFPEKGLDILFQTQWITCFPEISALVGLSQNPIYHSEGDVFTHTKMVCQQAVKLLETDSLSESQRAVLMFSALCHDFGKADCRNETRVEEGRCMPENHAHRGVKIAKKFFEKMKAPLWLPEWVLPIIAEHMTHLTAEAESPDDAQVRRLAVRLSPSDVHLWELLVMADDLGRSVSKRPPVPLYLPWVEKARNLGVYDRAPEPILLGRHLMDFGVKPGPGMGKILKNAWEAQLDGAFFTLEEALAWLGMSGKK